VLISDSPLQSSPVKLQLQLQRSVCDREFKGPIDCIRQIVAAQGVLGLWRGFTGSLAFRSGFFFMFLSFEVLMRLFTRLQGTQFEVDTNKTSKPYLILVPDVDCVRDLLVWRSRFVRILGCGHTCRQFEKPDNGFAAPLPTNHASCCGRRCFSQRRLAWVLSGACPYCASRISRQC